MAISFFSGAASFKRQWPLIEEQLDQIIEAGQFTNGPTVKRFEQMMEAYTGAKHCIAVGNATDALIIMLKAAGIGPGDEVIVPCFTFFASASSVGHVGATPVFCDIDPATYSISIEDIERKITERTKAIMPVHLFTQLADMKEIQRIADKHGLLVLEDSAEAIGMFHDSVHAGLIGKAGVISFFPTKTLGAIGDAGLILTNDDLLAHRVRRLRIHGQDEGVPYVYHEVGYNSRMDDIQAAVLLSRLPYLSQEIAKRAHLAALYDKYLAANPSIQTPVIREREDTTNPVYYVYLIECDRRNELVQYLTDNGIGTEVYYPLTLHTQPCFESLGYEEGSMPHAELACTRTVGLPLYPDLTEEEVAAVSAAINKFYEGGV
ncbi:DegT/DnrJ/EryC1/StrS family aminotransferase [Paenibacillus sp. SC116]|uniref:DegT/DnrJ/EryC1/StrS family aminotransferase n=1 Tax=Paenibacillus sp. SC116 TaxID=2968986 RepID=UPI00215A561A|nr:DegT/DnrJ/EryC1/StrS family aminotransferase [Paenibacillus sp. SC116]MCR8845911.1 DegT/DnrJ/EryC1/StrS family aminotransferase [Paenibacillus sp. SC116]